jgi:N-formylglutamate deformylase
MNARAGHPPWLEVHRGDGPLIVSFPHTGIEIPPDIEAQLVSPWLSRKDADWWVHLLYDFVQSLGATTVRTALSRTVIDVNRDPSGASLYPGQATTELCPTTTFDGEPLYSAGAEPDETEIARRRATYFDPYHDALAAELRRLRELHVKIVLYEAHSIRSLVPRLFEGELPNFNIGTNSGASCSPTLTAAIEAACSGRGFTHVTNGRFKGGWTTRHYGNPERDIHAVQMELACRGYMIEPTEPFSSNNWPSAYDPAKAAMLRSALLSVMSACVAFATTPSGRLP